MLLLSRLIPEFRTTKVVACCVANGACHVSPEEFVSLHECTPVSHTVLVQSTKVDTTTLIFKRRNASVGPTAGVYIYHFRFAFLLDTHDLWEKNRTQAWREGGREGVIPSQVVSVLLVWLHENPPWGLVSGSYFPAPVLNPTTFYLTFQTPSRFLTGDIFCLISASFSRFRGCLCYPTKYPFSF